MPQELAIEEIGEEGKGTRVGNSADAESALCIERTVGGETGVEILFNFFLSARASSCSKCFVSQGLAGPSFCKLRWSRQFSVTASWILILDPVELLAMKSLIPSVQNCKGSFQFTSARQIRGLQAWLTLAWAQSRWYRFLWKSVACIFFKWSDTVSSSSAAHDPQQIPGLDNVPHRGNYPKQIASWLLGLLPEWKLNISQGWR